MTIYAYGGGIGDYAVVAETADGVENLSAFAPGVTVQFWGEQVGGLQITDLALADGTPVTEITTSDGSGGLYAPGALPRFRAPVLAMWASADDGPRVLMLSTDLPTVMQDLTAAAQASALSAAASAESAAELAGSSSVTGHVAAADPHSNLLNNARGDLRYIQSALPAMAPLTAPLGVWQFTSTPASSDADMWQVYVTHLGVTRLVTWSNERGYYRAEQVAGALYDAPATLITAYNGTGRALLVQQRGADNIRRDVGGIDVNGRVVTSNQVWTDITSIDPGATGRYTEDTTTDVAQLQVRFDTNDVCRLQGRVAVNSSGTTSGQVVMVLPTGYRPAHRRYLPVATTTGIACPCEILTNGNVVVNRTQAGALNLAFDDLTFAIG